MASVAFSSAVEVRRACLRIARKHVLNLQLPPAPQRVVDLLMQKMRDVRHLFGFEARRGTPALQRMSLREKRPDFLSIAIVQNNERTDQVGSLLIAGQVGISASRLDAMAGDAFGDVDRFSALGAGIVHHMGICGAGSERTGATARSFWRAAAGSAAAPGRSR